MADKMPTPTAVMSRASDKKAAWSLISFACPVCAISFAMAMGRVVDDEDAAIRAAGIGGYSFFGLALVALIGAFVGGEKMKWLTLLPLALLMALFGLGISS